MRVLAVRGTAVALDPPPGMVPGSRFAGFERRDEEASILVLGIAGTRSPSERQFGRSAETGGAVSGVLRIETGGETARAGQQDVSLGAAKTEAAAPIQRDPEGRY